MSELIDRCGDGGTLLFKALAKTGPIIHRGLYVYSVTANRRGVVLTKSLNKGIRSARDSATVEVPAGAFPSEALAPGRPTLGRALIARFEGYARVLSSGVATAESRDDMESLADNLEELAREVRGHAATPEIDPPSCVAGRYGRSPRG